MSGEKYERFRITPIRAGIIYKPEYRKTRAGVDKLVARLKAEYEFLRCRTILIESTNEKPQPRWANHFPEWVEVERIEVPK